MPEALRWNTTVRVAQEIIRNERDRLLEVLSTILRSDERVLAAWLSGSFGRSTDDDWSDIDLHVAVGDEYLDGWLIERPALYERLGHPVLVRADKPSNAGPGLFQEVMFSGPITLDLNVHPASTARRGIDTRVLFDRLPLAPYEPDPGSVAKSYAELQTTVEFFWAMTSIALKYVARGQTGRAVTQFDLLLGVYVDAWRSIHQPERRDAGGAHWLHPVHDAELRDRLPVLGEYISRQSVLDAISRLMTEMTALDPDLDRTGVRIPAPAIKEITLFRNAVAADGLITGAIKHGE